MKYYLAPMEGITGYVFRNVYHSCFPVMDKYFTPFLSPNQTGKLGPREQRDVDPEHNRGMYVVPQILTSSADDFIRTSRTLQSLGYEEVNLNLGCPSGTVVSKGRGAGFLSRPEELDHCLYEIFSRLDMKVSVKTRLGRERPEEFEQLLDIYNRYAMEELIIHPRVREDYYKNRPHMDAFARAMEKSRNPVCYNGDIFRAEDCRKVRQRFPQLEAVMMGRGIIAWPGLLADILAEEKEGVRVWNEGAQREKLREFHDRLYEAYRQIYLKEAGPKVVLFKMKEIWCYLINAFESGEKPGKKIKKAQRLEDYEAAVDTMFRQGQVVAGGGYCGNP